MTDQELLAERAKFFLEEFDNDPVAVGDWLAQGEHEVDEVIEAARAVGAK